MIDDWDKYALCKTVADKDIFFPERGVSCEPARQVCNACPVKAECLDYALRHHCVLGIWGGTSERERRTIRRKTKAKV